MVDFILKWFALIFGIGVLAAFGWVIITGLVQHFREERRRKQRLDRPPGHFVFARIRDSVGPMERSEKYEHPLDRDLEAEGLGMVTGGGVQLDKNGEIEWVGLDLELADLSRGIEFTRRRLRELGAPLGSVLEYRAGEKMVTVEIV